MLEIAGSGTNWPALAAAIGGPVVGATGVAFGWLSTRGDREHTLMLAEGQQRNARALARDDRLYADLRSAYFELLTFLNLIGDVIHRTEPIIGPQPDPPEPPTDEETRELFARVAAIGSDDVAAALQELTRITRKFWSYVFTVRAIRDQQAGGAPFQELQETRELFAAKTREIEALIRAELRA
jgi:hypothetical protein